MSTLNYSLILTQGNCWANNYTIGIPIANYGYTCASHFYCPNTTSSVITSLPQICSPTIDCQILRLGGEFCEPQGQYEPQICPKGYYCPDYLTLKKCPKGSWCPLGSTYPRPCPELSSCSEGSIVPFYYGGLVYCLIIDIVLLGLIFYFKRLEKNRLKTLNKVMPADDQHHPANLESNQGSPLKQIKTDGQDVSRKKSLMPKAVLGITSKVNFNMHITQKGIKEEDEDTENKTNTNVFDHQPQPGQLLAAHSSEEDLQDIVRCFKRAMNNREDVHLDFRFEDLGLSLKDNITVLKGVTGTIKSNTLTAVMGPSGCGKTTFMSVLMGKVSRTFGKLYINEELGEVSIFKKIIGYVPQEDIMIRELTVRENITHSARCRLPSSWSESEIQSFVDAILHVLNLTHVQHNQIGDETTRGVSGGQRKRVNIGMELASAPIALFLDEPTSGLDSTAALKVAEILKKISSLGLTVVSVIHQPRFEIFQQFDELLMVAPGGKTAYLGPTALVIQYFESLGFYFDPRANPADILMDILSDKGINPLNHLSPNDLVLEWEKGGIGWIQKNRVSKTNNESKLTTTSHKDLDLIVKQRGASVWKQILFCHNRYFVQQYRMISSLFLEILVAALAGGLMGIALMGNEGQIFLGVVSSPYSLISPSPLEWLIPQIGLLIGMSCSLAGAPAGVKVFSEEKTIYFREAASGHSKIGYFVGKTISSTYRFLLGSLHFAAIFTFLALPSSPFYLVYFNIMLQFFGVYGLSAVVSMLVRREDGSLLAVIVCLIYSVFCGYGPTVKKARSWGVVFIWDLSYNRWATEAMYSSEISIFRDVFDIDSAASRYGFVLDKVGENLGLMFLIGMALRVIAFIFLIFTNRDKQK